MSSEQKTKMVKVKWAEREGRKGENFYPIAQTGMLESEERETLLGAEQ